MSSLTVNPNVEIFSSVPEYEKAIEEFNDKHVLEKIEVIGKIFVKHNASKHFGVTLVHRHFDMTPAEILVETINDEKTLSVTIPWNFKGKSASPTDSSVMDSYKIRAKNYIEPRHWCFTPSGELVAFEFLATDEKSGVQPTPEFSMELFSALKELGVEKLIGLRRITDINVGSWETTPEGKRANITVFGEVPKNMKSQKMSQVGWRFNNEGKIMVDGKKAGSGSGNGANICFHGPASDICFHEPTSDICFHEPIADLCFH